MMSWSRCTEFGMHADAAIIFPRLALRSTLDHFIASMDNFNFSGKPSFLLKLTAIIEKLHVLIPQEHIVYTFSFVSPFGVPKIMAQLTSFFIVLSVFITTMSKVPTTIPSYLTAGYNMQRGATELGMKI